ncbi:MAG: hypothetical protein H6Q00_3573 [Holophagaceae bacterium]|nr:hypothetical protein [Holophagaceae bacterium]
MKIQRFILGALTVLGVLFSTGCVAIGTDTSGTAIYAFDATDSKILVWDDAETLYDDTSTDPTRTLTSAKLADLAPLASGGMCLNRSQGRLWLISESGLIARIDSIRSRSGAITSSYIRTFQLGDGDGGDDDVLDSSTFGQLAVDGTSGTLYATEYNSSTTRIWAITSPLAYADGDTVAATSVNLLKVSGDKHCLGVAAFNSKLFGFFYSGSSVEDSNTDTYTGPRLRLGTASGFASDSSVIVGTSNTLLSECKDHGLLAADSTNGLVYVCRTAGPIAFKNAKFSTSYDVAPSLELPAPSAALVTIAHPGTKDWLVGTGTPATSSTTLWMWKSPSTDTTTSPVAFAYGTAIRAIAMDGSASTE